VLQIGKPLVCVWHAVAATPLALHAEQVFAVTPLQIGLATAEELVAVPFSQSFLEVQPHSCCRVEDWAAVRHLVPSTLSVQKVEPAPVVAQPHMPVTTKTVGETLHCVPAGSPAHCELAVQAWQTLLTHAGVGDVSPCGQSVSPLQPQAPVPRQTGVMPPLSDVHCELEEQATQLEPLTPGLLQTGLVVVVVESQSELAVQPQTWRLVRHFGVAPLHCESVEQPTQTLPTQLGVVPPQFASDRHCTQVLVVVLHCVFVGLPLQSAVSRHPTQE